MTQALVDLDVRVREALRGVVDPELGYNVVDLGLVYGIAVTDDDTVSITMTTTTAGCPATGYLVEGVRACAAAVDGVDDVRVHLTYEPPWSHALMSDDAQAFLGIVAADDPARPDTERRDGARIAATDLAPRATCQAT